MHAVMSDGTKEPMLQFQARLSALTFPYLAFRKVVAFATPAVSSVASIGLNHQRLWLGSKCRKRGTASSQ
jgi:hypothetical protein